MERKEMAGAVPTEVVEIVRPGRAVERKGELELGARAAACDELVRPENRPIWTNDNLVALQTLMEERDRKTKDWRYRGKVAGRRRPRPLRADEGRRSEGHHGGGAAKGINKFTASNQIQRWRSAQKKTA